MTEFENQISFYDSMEEYFLRDYIFGNPRIDASCRFFLDEIPHASVNILEIGCGIGYTTHYIAKSRPSTNIKAIDLSPNSIKIANQLFKIKNVEFSAINILTDNYSSIKFDIIIMSDVYEHIPKSSRDNLHDFIGTHLKTNGKVLMTFPSCSHQTYLHNLYPDRLQPVDENITLLELKEFETGTNTDLVKLSTVSIFNTNDYVHTVFCRTNFDPLNNCSYLSPKRNALRHIKKCDISLYNQLMKLLCTEIARHSFYSILKNKINCIQLVIRGKLKIRSRLKKCLKLR